MDEDEIEGEREKQDLYEDLINNDTRNETKPEPIALPTPVSVKILENLSRQFNPNSIKRKREIYHLYRPLL
ncbi:UNKNOWN [Stylonychia lemnae]|uniref:Uncharacterized protein n=1 Tax=Stylonychia lemnae TaxID=5949 RepID=A0A078AR54_STYLE|nr:UNKNOWN [Stylonychia lemnae]|eukprot:CDW84885.1 UNKNOWN [Stylonychia lemnae]